MHKCWANDVRPIAVIAVSRKCNTIPMNIMVLFAPRHHIHAFQKFLDGLLENVIFFLNRHILYI
ncbi:MAG: hypothetical protein ACK55I_18850, partial [bacterium]